MTRFVLGALNIDAYRVPHILEIAAANEVKKC